MYRIFLIIRITEKLCFQDNEPHFEDEMQKTNGYRNYVSQDSVYIQFKGR